MKKKISPGQGEKLAQEKQAALMQELAKAYSIQLDEEMGNLHNQFVAFISAASVPLPQVLLVLEILLKETIEQAYHKYLGEK